MIPLEHSKTHSPDRIHPTHRQDIGKVSLWDSVFCVNLQISITYQVFILPGKYNADDTSKEMAIKYLNRFSIEEDDQFEIHVKDYPDKHFFNMSEADYYNAAKEVILKAQQG